MCAPHRFFTWWARKQHQSPNEWYVQKRYVHVFIRGFSGTWNHFSRCVQLIRARIVVTELLVRTKRSGEHKTQHINWLRSSMKFSVCAVEMLRCTHSSYTRTQWSMYCMCRELGKLSVFRFSVGSATIRCGISGESVLFAFHCTLFIRTESRNTQFLLVWERILFWSRFVRFISFRLGSVRYGLCAWIFRSKEILARLNGFSILWSSVYSSAFHRIFYRTVANECKWRTKCFFLKIVHFPKWIFIRLA